MEESIVNHVKCPECGGEVTSDSDFCPHCGELFEGSDALRCSFHPQNRAVAVCIICQRTVCEECGKKKQNRWLCPDHSNVTVEQDWALIFQSPDINEAELVKSVLESIGKKVVARNFGPNNVVWEGGGDSLFSRQALNRLAKLFVPIPEYDDAKKALREWESSNKSPTSDRNIKKDPR